MRACSLHRHALKRACPSYRHARVRACSTYGRALERAYPIHSRTHMRSCAANRRAHSACPCPPYRCPHACLSGGQARMCVRLVPDLPCTWGPTLIKPLVWHSVQPLPKKGNPNSMQNYQTTNLKLVGP
jgi:hypothetical protein